MQGCPAVGLPAPPSALFLQQCTQARQGLVQGPLPAVAVQPILDRAAAARLIQDGLQACYTLEQQYAWAPTTTTVRERAVQELNGWLSQLPREYGVHLGNITPEILGVYVMQHWLPKHAGTVLANGDKIAAPSSLDAMLAHLSTHFQRLGRQGPFGLLQPHVGNPVESFLVDHLKTAHSRRAWALGYEEGSAVPMSLQKLEALVRCLDADSMQAVLEFKYHEALVLQRDAVAFLYAWECGQRGKEVGELQLANVQDVHGQPVLPLADNSPALSVEFVVAPSGTKTRKRQRAGVLPVRLDPALPIRFCLMRRLDTYVRMCALAQEPVTGFLFRICKGRGFDERGITSSESPAICGIWFA